MIQDDVLEILLFIVCVLLSAFFSSSEVGLISMTRAKVRTLVNEHRPGASAVAALKESPEHLLITLLIGNTIVNITAASIATAVAIQEFGDVGVGIATGFVVIVLLIFGEIGPKIYAARASESFALTVAPIILFMSRIFSPIIWLVERVSPTFGIGKEVSEPAVTEEEIKEWIDVGKEEGTIEQAEQDMLYSVLEFGDTTTREIMTPRQKIFSLPSNLAVEAATAQVIEHKRSRVPVYDETRGPEHIIGAVYSKDLARLMFFRSSKPVDNLTLRDVMRDILVVPETKSVLDLLRDLQQRRRPIAIVVDEYGSTVGLVTMEDAIEQLTGELEDEFDAPALPVLPTADGALLMDGGLNLRDLETEMQWDLPRKGGIETLAGFLLMRLGHIPKVVESITHEGRRLTVVEMDNRRIAKIRVEPVEEALPAAANPSSSDQSN